MRHRVASPELPPLEAHASPPSCLESALKLPPERESRLAVPLSISRTLSRRYFLSAFALLSSFTAAPTPVAHRPSPVGLPPCPLSSLSPGLSLPGHAETLTPYWTLAGGEGVLLLPSPRLPRASGGLGSMGVMCAARRAPGSGGVEVPVVGRSHCVFPEYDYAAKSTTSKRVGWVNNAAYREETRYYVCYRGSGTELCDEWCVGGCSRG